MSAAIALHHRVDCPMNTLVLRGEPPPVREMDDASPTPAREVDDAAPFACQMERDAPSVMPNAAPSASGTCVMKMLPVEAIRLTPEQMQRCLDDAGVEPLESIDRLAAAIRENGPLQSVLVRPVEGGYALITGNIIFTPPKWPG